MRRPPRSTQGRSSAASDVYKRQVIMIAGNALKIPTSILDPLRTLTGNIALELAYATGDHRLSLFSTGVVLLVIIMILNYIANFGIKRKVLK